MEPGDVATCVICEKRYTVPEDAPFKMAICPECTAKQQGCTG